MNLANTSDAELIKIALEQIRKLKLEVALKENAQKNIPASAPIAIIGAACRFAGGIHSLEKYWEFLEKGGVAVSDAPEERWKQSEVTELSTDAAGNYVPIRAHFLKESVKDFDPFFFSISPKEAESLDPQQRLLLELSWHALENGGISPTDLKGSKTGVFIGIIGSDFIGLQRPSTDWNQYTLSGVTSHMASGRISHILGLQGPSVSIDTACSSSLVALHLACQSIQRGESETALVGGVNLILTPLSSIILSKVGALAKDGLCKSFDASGDGYGRGEGGGMIVLKSLDSAKRDGDRILAVVRGTAINHDGESSGLTVPSCSAQQSVIRDALKKSGTNPEQISYLEAHGTGTPLGDPIEFEAIEKTLGGRTAANPLLVGSLKANIGHTEGAAGIAGIIKLILCFKNRKLPKQVCLDRLNPRIDLTQVPALIPKESQDWIPPLGGKLIASISSFGFSGTNAHAILEAPSDGSEISESSGPSATEEDLITTSKGNLKQTFVLSAKTEKALVESMQQFLSFLESHPHVEFRDLSYTVCVGRAHFDYRMTFDSNNSADLRRELLEKTNKLKTAGLNQLNPVSSEGIKLALLFGSSGSGASSSDSGLWAKQAYGLDPTFKKSFTFCSQILESHLGESLLPYMDSSSHPSDQSALQVNKRMYGRMQSAIHFCNQYALVEMLKSYGLAPTAVSGQGQGVLLAAHFAGILKLETCAEIIGNSTADKPVSLAELDKQSLNPPKIIYLSMTSGKSIKRSEAINPGFWKLESQAGENIQFELDALVKQGYAGFMGVGFKIKASPTPAKLFDPTQFELFSDFKFKLINYFYSVGAQLNWKEIYSGQEFRKLELPLYPFQKQPYWPKTIHPFGTHQSSSTVQDYALKAYPVFSPNQETQFRFQLSRLKLPQSKDTSGLIHVGYYLEMVCCVLEKTLGQARVKSFDIDELAFVSPLILTESGSKEISVTYRDDDQKGPLLEFRSLEEGLGLGSSWDLHARIHLRLKASNSEAPLYSTLDQIEKLKKTSKVVLSGDEFYQRMEQKGVHLGPSLRWIKQVWIQDSEILALMKRPLSSEINADCCLQIAPGVFDACAQLFQLVVEPQFGVMISKWAGFQFSSTTLSEDLWCYAKVTEPNIDQKQVRGSFQLITDDGLVLAQCGQQELTRVNLGVLNRLSSSHLNAPADTGQTLKEVINQTSNEAKIQVIQNFLLSLVSEFMGIPKSEVDAKVKLRNYGIDSMVGLALSTKIVEVFRVELPIASLVKGPSLSELSTEVFNLIQSKGDLSVAVTDQAIGLKLGRSDSRGTYQKEAEFWLKGLSQSSLQTEQGQTKKGIKRGTKNGIKHRLFCFPYGGGGASLYQDWQAYFPEEIEVCSIQLPGREERIQETPIDDLGELLENLSKVLSDHLDCPYSFYGHSMGALVAYSLAMMLQKKSMNQNLKQVFLAGFTAPSVFPVPYQEKAKSEFKSAGFDGIPTQKDIEQLNSEQIKQLLPKVVETRFMPGEELEKLGHLILPMLFADFKIVESFKPLPDGVLDVSILGFHGVSDDRVKLDEMKNWEKFTKNKFNLYSFKGDHFFLHKNQAQKEVIECIKNNLIG